MITLNTNSKETLQEQIGNEFKKLILIDAFREGDKVPSVRDLACILLLSPNTVSKAYREFLIQLKGMGLI